MKTSRKLFLTLLVAASLVLAAGCGSSESAATPTDTTGTPPPATPSAHGDTPPTANPPAGDPPAAAPSGAVVTDTGFELRATASGPYHAGQLGTFGIALTPNGEYHVNEEYPIRVTVRAPSELTLPKTSLERGDAAEFSAQKARFDVPFTPTAAGERRVEVQVDFAICTPQNCMPDQRTLALVLPVE